MHTDFACVNCQLSTSYPYRSNCDVSKVGEGTLTFNESANPFWVLLGRKD